MTEKPTIYDALAAVRADVPAVGKNERNRDQNYNFRGIDAVVNAVSPALRRHGVLVIPELLEANYRDVQTSRGKPSRECTVKVRYTFYGPRGDSIECVTPGESMDFSDKGAPKAMSVAYRIALLQALSLPTDEPDPDSQSYEREADPADEARADLRQLCDERRLDTRRVAAAFAARYGGTDLRFATHPAQIRAFAQALATNPEQVLGNGQPAPSAQPQTNSQPVGASA